MKRPLVLLAGLLAGLVVLGGSAVAAPVAGGSAIESQQMTWHAQMGPPLAGTAVDAGAKATLVRTRAGIFFLIRTHGLAAGHAYTVWLVVVNVPSKCAAFPCSAADFFTDPSNPTKAQVTYGAGTVVGGSGRAVFVGGQWRGPMPDGWISNQGLDDPLGAEVHLVINDHGPVIPSLMPEMIRTYRAGCTDASLPPIFPASAKADGTPGPNTCRLTQFAVFP